MLVLKTRQHSRPTLLSALADPWMGPIQVALLVGAASHWTWAWLILWLLGWLVVSGLFGVGHALMDVGRRRAVERFLNDDRYELRGVPETSLPVLDLPQVQRILSSGTENQPRLLVFICRGRTRKIRLNFTSHCVVGGPNFPSLILLPEIPQTPQAQFELLHEFGHATAPALNAEIYLRLDPVFALLVAGIASTLVEPTWVFAVWCALWLSTRCFYWFTARLTGIESELIADAFAYTVATTYDRTLASARPFVRAWERVGSIHGDVLRRVQSRARLRLWNGYHSEGMILPVDTVQYSVVGMIATLGLVLGTFFTRDDAWRAVAACLTVVAICFLLTYLLMRKSHESELVLRSRLMELSKV